MENGRVRQSSRGAGGYVAYDDLRQVVRDLLAPLYERLDALRDEVNELKRRPAEEANNRRGDVLVICSIIGAIVAVSTCGSGLLSIGVAILLHFAR